MPLNPVHDMRVETLLGAGYATSAGPFLQARRRPGGGAAAGTAKRTLCYSTGDCDLIGLGVSAIGMG
jgi:hypothetical protein